MTVSTTMNPGVGNLHRHLFSNDNLKLQKASASTVRASGHLPQGCTSNAIRVSKLHSAEAALSRRIRELKVCLNGSGVLDLDVISANMRTSDLHWVRELRLADDCHSNNVQLKLLEDGKLCLQTVRDISDGQELVLWFSQDVLAIMQMGFLTLANIRGQKQYVCTKCSMQFETPNPLKLHITLQCSKNPLELIWARLVQKLTQNSYEKHLSTFRKFEFKLHPKIKTETTNENGNSTNNSLKTSPQIYRPFSEPPRIHTYTSPNSAFKPFKKEHHQLEGQQHGNNNNTIKSSQSVTNISSYWSEPMWAPSPTPETHPGVQLMHEVVVNNQAAHIEALVSSLGKSKQGHYCLYCGKCYSRKYGLKIHIRTHTGYKPLKCKFCARPFGDPSNLNKHVRLHAEGDTPYRCELCSKVLVRRRDLERHLKSRHMTEMHPGSSTINVADDESDTDISEEDVIV